VEIVRLAYSARDYLPASNSNLPSSSDKGTIEGGEYTDNVTWVSFDAVRWLHLDSPNPHTTIKEIIQIIPAEPFHLCVRADSIAEQHHHYHHYYDDPRLEM
jgi:hypothetical protein